MTVYLVIGYTGAHEPGAVFSVWDSVVEAVAEAKRIAELPDDQSMIVIELELNRPCEIDKHGYATAKN